MRDDDPKYAWAFSENKICTVLSLGRQTEEEILHAFDEGRYIDALILEERAVKSLFELEKQVQREIVEWCRQRGMSIIQKISEISEIKVFFSGALREMVALAQKELDIDVRVNDSGMMIPGKSLCVGYLIENDEKGKEIEDADQFCSICERMDCPYRNSE